MEDTNKRLLRYLNDSYASEVGGLMALKDLALMAADRLELRHAIEDHIRVSESQAERLTQRILALGGDKSEPKAVVNSIIAKGSSLVNAFHDKEDKLTQDLIKAYAFEHFEMGAYTALHSYASEIGDLETATLAEQILAEEQFAADNLFRFLPNVAAQPARSSTPIANEPRSGSLLAVPPAAFLIPGAVLAVWGVSKWLGNRQNVNSFATATNTYAQDYEVAVLEPSMATVGSVDTNSTEDSMIGGTTVFHGENAYVPSSIEPKE